MEIEISKHSNRYLCTRRWLREVYASRALTGIKVDSTGEPQRDGDQRRSSADAAALLVGMPVITSPAGLCFWLDLCGVSKRDSICKEAFAAFRTVATSDKEEYDDMARLKNRAASTEGTVRDKHNFSKTAVGKDSTLDGESAAGELLPYGQRWFETTMLKLRALNRLGVTGVHVMAPGPGPRRRAQVLVDGGVFGLVRK